VHIVIDARLPRSGVGGVQNVIVSFAQGFNQIQNSTIKRTWLTYKDASWLIPIIPNQDKIIFEEKKWLRFERLLRSIFVSQLISLYFIIIRNKNSYDKTFSEIKPDLVILPFQNSLSTSYPYIYFPHDLLHEYYPQYFTVIQRFLRKKVWRQKALKAQAVVCETEIVKRDLINFWGIESKKIELLVTPPNLPKSNESQSNKNYQKKEKIIYYPAAFWEHKNQKNLIKSMSYFEHSKYDIKLILSGHKVEKSRQIIKTLPKFLQKKIITFGHIKRDKFEELLNTASVIAIPSIFESLSLVGFEALVNYKPIACSDIPQFRIQMLNQAVYFDPFDPKDIAMKIQNQFEKPSSCPSYYYAKNELLLRNFVESFIFICQKYTGIANDRDGERANKYMSDPQNFFTEFPNKLP
jgi:glycosyltransferase involved in cell wall biosynthesis